MLIGAAVTIAVAAIAYSVTRPPERRNVLMADGAATVSVMNFASPIALDPPRRIVLAGIEARRRGPENFDR